MLYHGTTEKYLADITTSGVCPRGKTGEGNWKHSCDSHPDAVYLSVAYALYFAHAALKDTTDKSKLVVLEIDESQLEPERLRADEDAMEQLGRGRDGLPKSWSMLKRNEYYKKNLKKFPHDVSIAALGNCTYFGTIPTKAIKRVATMTQSLYTEMLMRGYDPTITIMNYRLLGDRYRDTTTWLFDPDGVKNVVEDWGMVQTVSLPLPDTRDGLEVLDFTEVLQRQVDTRNQGSPGVFMS